ncbi:MAG: indole-3-glycerol phosphate synthase TrpC, partial [Oscillospiraceae bacterium]|nr:indole-3-glycerol phosphate synthase TrpC [Oscillospiraceae bacterium]
TSPALPGPFSFESNLRLPGPRFICEVKKASPSKGIIAGDFPYIEIAREYEIAGASAISVLTEPDYFHGSDQYLQEIRNAVSLPLLRKDFIIDPFQIEQAFNLGADAVLLICAILTQSTLREFIEIADKLGLSCLVEVHDEQEAKMAVQSGARIIGINNRDLKTFAVDIANSVKLREFIPQKIIVVSESGITTADDVNMLRKNGIDAFLVGERLMRAKDKGAALAALRGPHADEKRIGHNYEQS